MPSFSANSLTILQTCDSRLQEICEEAIKIFDFTVIYGFRSETEQEQLFQQGKSKLHFPESKHNQSPSLAVDLAPYPIDWNDHDRFNILAGIMFGIAHSKGIKIRWGGDWNQNWNLKEETFRDLVHFELV